MPVGGCQVAHAKRDYELSSADYDFWNVRAPVMSAVRSAALTWVRLCYHSGVKLSKSRSWNSLTAEASALIIVSRFVYGDFAMN